MMRAAFKAPSQKEQTVTW